MHAAAMHEDLEPAIETQMRTIRVATMEGLASGYLARRIQEITLDDASIRDRIVQQPSHRRPSQERNRYLPEFLQPDDPRPHQPSKSARPRSISTARSATARAHGKPTSQAELGSHRYVGYIPEMISIESVRWLDQLVPNANLVFCSNSVIAQRNAAIAGAGLVVLPTFVGDENSALFRILPDQIRILRPVWMSVGTRSACSENHQPVGQSDRAHLRGRQEVSARRFARARTARSFPTSTVRI